jgi:ATP-dependent RNA helicase HelY
VQRTKVKSITSKGGERTAREHPVSGDPELRRKLIAAKSADRIDGELKLIEERIRKSVQTVSARFDDLVQLMERRGYVENWRLTEQGRSLSRIFHELDLLIAEALENQIFDGLEPAELAALLSVFVYEFRRAEEAPKARVPKSLVGRWKELQRLSSAIGRDEESSGVAAHRDLDAGLIETTFEWATGADLIARLDDDLTAGDFVRTMKQLIDLLRQISEIAPDTATAINAEKATKLILRGVVAASQGPAVAQS